MQDDGTARRRPTRCSPARCRVKKNYSRWPNTAFVKTIRPSEKAKARAMEQRGSEITDRCTLFLTYPSPFRPSVVSLPFTFQVFGQQEPESLTHQPLWRSPKCEGQGSEGPFPFASLVNRKPAERGVAMQLHLGHRKGPVPLPRKIGRSPIWQGCARNESPLCRGWNYAHGSSPLITRPARRPLEMASAMLPPTL